MGIRQRFRTLKRAPFNSLSRSCITMFNELCMVCNPQVLININLSSSSSLRFSSRMPRNIRFCRDFVASCLYQLKHKKIHTFQNYFEQMLSPGIQNPSNVLYEYSYHAITVHGCPFDLSSQHSCTTYQTELLYGELFQAFPLIAP